MLTKREAEELVLTCLRGRLERASLSIDDQATVERPFGWMFLVIGTDIHATDAIAAKLPRTVIVNKHSLQVVASSIDREPAQFAKVYEKLLSANQRRGDNWCGTLSVPFPWRFGRKRSVAELAKEAGFYEIRGEENEP